MNRRGRLAAQAARAAIFTCKRAYGRLRRGAARLRLQNVGRVKPPKMTGAAWSQRITVAFFSPSNLNRIDGSTIWVESVAGILHADERLGIVIPLLAPDRRTTITGSIRKLNRVDLVNTAWFKKGSSLPMTPKQSVKALTWLDKRKRFDLLLVRSYRICIEAVRRADFSDRLWSAYFLEPELDVGSSDYLRGMTDIVRGSERVVVQSQGMQALLERLVPEATGRVVQLPPAVPSTMPPPPPAQRLFYTGKFAPHYPIFDLVAAFVELRASFPDLEFHVAGDKIYRPPDDPEYPERVEAVLRGTEGLVWHGGISRQAVLEMFAQGGVALNVWQPQYGDTMNDLVIPTKSLDYMAAGLPVIAQQTSTHRSMLGEDYPLFASSPADVVPLVDEALRDLNLYRSAAERCNRGAEPFTYENVSARLRIQMDEALAARG